jgi:peptidylprolyl isomerase
MPQAREGDTIKVHYTGRLEDGRVFDSSRDREPMEITVGQHEVIPGFEQAVTGMETGQTKTVTIPCDEAYGPIRQDLLVTISRTDIPRDIDLMVGQRLEVQPKDGPAAMVKVAALSDRQVVLDANHPLAGEDLTFDLELVEIVTRH